MDVLKKIDIQPSNMITFQGTFDDETKQDMTINNPTDQIIAFKLKGTSPDIIRQRPGSGYVKPKEKVTIAVTVASLKNRKSMPKTQRLTTLLVVAPANPPSDATDLWKNEASIKTSRRQVVKLKMKRTKAKKEGAEGEPETVESEDTDEGSSEGESDN